MRCAASRTVERALTDGWRGHRTARAAACADVVMSRDTGTLLSNSRRGVGSNHIPLMLVTLMAPPRFASPICAGTAGEAPAPLLRASPLGRLVLPEPAVPAYRGGSNIQFAYQR